MPTKGPVIALTRVYRHHARPVTSYHILPPHRSIRVSESVERRLTRSTLVLLAEEDELGLVVDGEHTGTGNTTEDVGTSTLEERADTLSGDDLAGGIHGRLVLDGLRLISM